MKIASWLMEMIAACFCDTGNGGLGLRKLSFREDELGRKFEEMSISSYNLGRGCVTDNIEKASDWLLERECGDLFHPDNECNFQMIPDVFFSKLRKCIMHFYDVIIMLLSLAARMIETDQTKLTPEQRKELDRHKANLVGDVAEKDLFHAINAFFKDFNDGKIVVFHGMRPIDARRGK